jgi:transglutaminase-like putative cysteine protease
MLSSSASDGEINASVEGSTGLMNDLSAYLHPGSFVDSDHPDVIAFAREAIGDAGTDLEKTARLFRAVREKVRYDPYSLSARREDNVASAVLRAKGSYCIPKAVLLAAAARAVGLPARVGFADVRNHLSSPKLLDYLGTDLFVWHGFTEVWADGKAYKLTPAFNAALCERFGVKVLDFDPASPADALLQPFDGEGRQYMEYVADHGFFVDLPFEEITAALKRTYPKMSQPFGGVDAVFSSG